MENRFTVGNPDAVVHSKLDDNQRIRIDDRPFPAYIQIGEDFKIFPDGTVESHSIDAASEAGLIFTNFVRSYLHQTGIKKCCSQPKPHGHDPDCYLSNPLNKSDDLRFLSEIIDAWDDGKGIAAAVKIIRAQRERDRSFAVKLTEVPHAAVSSS